jgi:hypothetical protein
MKRRQLSKRGTLLELEGGGVVRVLPDRDNAPYVEKSRVLMAAAREELGLDPDADLEKHLSYIQRTALVVRSMIGTVIRWWDGFDDEVEGEEEGIPIPCVLDAFGEITNEDDGVRIFMFPGVSSALQLALDKTNARHAATTEAIIGDEEKPGNLLRPSAGTSGTEAT